MSKRTTTQYPSDVARQVSILRPDLAATDAIAAVLMEDPRLTAEQVIEILDEAAEEYAAEREIEVGARVEAGKGVDRDTGRVIEREAKPGFVWVAWDGALVQTESPISTLRRI